MNSLQTSQFVIIRIDAQTKEQPCIATVHNFVIAKLFGPTCQTRSKRFLPHLSLRNTKREKRHQLGNNDGKRWMYLYKVTLVALITRGYETVYFAFDLVLLVILFWGWWSAQRFLFWGKKMW